MVDKNNKDNVIQFPYPQSSLDAPVTKEQSKECIENVRMEHIEDSLDLFMEMFTHYIESGGFNLEKAHPKHFCLFSESLKALLCSCYLIDHSFHGIAENVVVEKNGEFFIKDFEIVQTLITENE